MAPTKLFVQLFCLIFFFGALPLCYADKLSDICQEAMRMPPLLRSFHYTFLSKSTPPTPEGEEPKRYIAQMVTVWQAGHEIRTETTVLPEKPGGKVDPLFDKGFVCAYNGLKYQWFSPGKETLVFSDRCRQPSPYYITCPLIYPYHWLGEQQANWSDIKDPERWLKRFEKAKYVGREKAASYRPQTIKIQIPAPVGYGSVPQYKEITLYGYVEEEKGEGLTFDVVSMPPQQMDADDVKCEVKVYFARELGYYPLKWVAQTQRKGGQITMDFRVTDYQVFDVDEQKLIFPYAAKFELLGKENGKEKGEGMTQKFATEEGIKPLQINIPLDEQLFTISPSLAKTVTDFDAEIESGRVMPSTDVGDDGRSLKNTPPPVAQWGVGRTMFLIMSNLVLLLIIFLLWRSRSRRK